MSKQFSIQPYSVSRAIVAMCVIMKRDLKLIARSPGYVINPLVFYLLVASFFPLGVSANPKILADFAGGIIWIGALLAVLLSLDSLFKNDELDGTLNCLLLSPCPLALLVMGKVIAHWLLLGIALILLAPLLAIMLHLPPKAFPALMLSLLIGTPILSLIGAIGSALTARLQKSSLLLTVIALPLYVPVLIFATAAINSAANDLPYFGHLLFLLGFLILGLSLAPIAISASLKIVVEG